MGGHTGEPSPRVHAGVGFAPIMVILIHEQNIIGQGRGKIIIIYIVDRSGLVHRWSPHSPPKHKHTHTYTYSLRTNLKFLQMHVS